MKSILHSAMKHAPSRVEGSNVPAIILAGGESKRMGFPKALLKVGRRTLADDQVARLAKAGCRPIVVVIAPSPLPSPSRGEGEGEGDIVIYSVNRRPRLGQFSSIKCGLLTLQKRGQATFFPKKSSLSPFLRGCIILPVDCPFVPVSVIRGIASPPKADRNDTPDAIIPTYSRKKGHPVWISKKLIQKILKTSTKKGRLDAILRGNIKYIAVKSRAILNNVNTMKQWRSASGRLS